MNLSSLRPLLPPVRCADAMLLPEIPESRFSESESFTAVAGAGRWRGTGRATGSDAHWLAGGVDALLSSLNLNNKSRTPRGRVVDTPCSVGCLSYYSDEEAGVGRLEVLRDGPLAYVLRTQLFCPCRKLDDGTVSKLSRRVGAVVAAAATQAQHVGALCGTALEHLRPVPEAACPDRVDGEPVEAAATPSPSQPLAPSPSANSVWH